MTIEFDPQQPAGSRVLSITVGGAPLDPNKTYRVATNDFMARGGDGYATFAAVDPLLPLEDTPLLSDEVMIYLRDLGTACRAASKAASPPNSETPPRIAARRRSFESRSRFSEPARSSRPATPAATLRPVWAWPLNGCNAMVLPEPPISALAPSADADRSARGSAAVIAGQIPTRLVRCWAPTPPTPPRSAG